MNPEHELRHDDLGRALQALPLARAPRTLAPRVMAAVAARLARAAGRVDYTWFDWPVWARAASALALAAVIVAAVWGWPLVDAAFTRVADHGVVRLATQFVRAIWQPAVLGLSAVITVVALVCATFGALLGRVALGGATR